MATARRVVFLAFDGVQSLDVTGPLEVFHLASRIAPPGYASELVSTRRAHLRSASGLTIVADRTLKDCRGPIDTLVVPGGTGTHAEQHDERTLRWLKEAAARSRRVASVCTGAFLLARAGLLHGRRATTHWSAAAALARQHPAIDVDPDAIFVRDDDVFTSAGITAGMDLALALVEDDLGPEVAREVARWLVLFVRRPGGQSQFSAQLEPQPAQRSALRELQAWMAHQLNGDLSVAVLASRTHMSERNFARAFRAEVGLTPAVYVESLRVERARIALEASDEPIDQVARRCGFGTPATMRRAFHRRLAVTPGDYRSRFRTALRASA